MTIFWKSATTLAIVALTYMLTPGCVFACSCAPPGPPLESLANASAVFSGRVTAISGAAEQGGVEPIVVTFAVAQRWKGDESATLQIATPTSSASCGVQFVESQEYLVYASMNEGKLTTNLCSRTTQLSMAGEDLAALGVSSSPSAPGGEVAQPTLPATGSATASISQPLAWGGMLLVIVGAFIRRQRSDRRS